ncbi:MAG: hypothetical protein WCG26_11970 [Chloroflexales bacterium]
MTLIDLTLNLPDDLANEATTQGLLTAPMIEQLLRTELTRRRTEQFFGLLDQLAVAAKADLSETDLQAEIDAYRQER